MSQNILFHEWFYTRFVGVEPRVLKKYNPDIESTIIVVSVLKAWHIINFCCRKDLSSILIISIMLRQDPMSANRHSYRRAKKNQQQQKTKKNKRKQTYILLSKFGQLFYIDMSVDKSVLSSSKIILFRFVLFML